MSQLLRQIGVVIGLTVILTFPVTVVSGAGSQKQPGHMGRIVAVTGGKGQMHGAVDNGQSRLGEVWPAMRTLSLDEKVKDATTHSQH
ncbi:MAG TPA: hypothetical protein VFO87_01820 [Nitrospira sp.]|nr:hypothetical protein [Nitrospira sp.]